MSEKNSRKTFRSAVSVALMLVSTIFAARMLPSITLQNNLETWLSKDDEQALALRRMESYFPPEEKVLVSWDSISLSDTRCNSFRDQLQESEYVRDVKTAPDLVDRMVDWKVEEAEAVRRLTGLLIGPQSHPAASSDSVVSIVLTLSDKGIADPAMVVAEIEAAAAASEVPATELHVDGALITSLAIDREVKASTWNLVDPWQRPPVFAISAVFGILLAFFVLRSVRLGIMVTASAWFTALVTTALFPAMGHSMNMVTIVMPTLLVVLTISAAIHVANYWKHASANGAEHPVQEAIRMGWPPCLMATVTTCVGLASLTISRLGPIRDFGAFSTVGVLLSFVVVIVAFPAMLRLSKMNFRKRRAASRIWQKVARIVCRARNPVIIGSVLLFFATAFGLQWLKTEVKVGRYFPEHSQLIQDSRFFENNVGGTSSIDVLIHFGDDYSDKKLFLERMELVRTVEEAIRQHPNITGAISLADFQPKTPLPESQAGRGARTNYMLRSRRTEQKIKRDEFAASSEYLAISTEPNFAWSLGSDIDETWRITAQTLLSKDLDYGTITRELSETVEATLGRPNGTWFDVTGSVPVFYQAQTALLDSLIRSLGLAFVVIAITMIVLLRSIPAGLMSSIPGVFPIAVVFGLMSWSGQVLDIGTMLTGSVALGIAVDDILHLLTWFRAAIRKGKSREDAVVMSLQHCGGAMTQTTLVIGLSLLLLYPADLLLISRFGWVMAALLGMAWLSSVVLLPALLAGPLGRLIENVESPNHNSDVVFTEESQIQIGASDVPTADGAVDNQPPSVQPQNLNRI